MKKYNILISNDDSIYSNGIKALVETAKQWGNVTVVAPDKPQSGMGHAVTLDTIVQAKEVHLFGTDVKAYACSGTPADCTKLAIGVLMETPPDLVLSGINHGSNTATSVIYSGTMAAAIEAAMSGITGIGISLCDSSSKADFSASKQIIQDFWTQYMLTQKIKQGTCLNINIPKLDYSLIKGLQPCRQTMGYWKENFEERTSPKGEKYYWLSGYFLNTDSGQDNDEFYLSQNYATIVPISYDLTDYTTLSTLK